MFSSPGLRVITSNGTLVSLLCENSPSASPSSPPSRCSSSESFPAAPTSEETLPNNPDSSSLPWVDNSASSSTVDHSPPSVTPISRPRLSTCSAILGSDSTADTTSHKRKSTSCPTSPTLPSTEPLEGAPKRKYQCVYPGCYKSFTTSGHLARHNRVHTKEKNYPCLMAGCTSKFSRKDNMMQHFRTHATAKLRRGGYRTPDSVSPQRNSYWARHMDFHQNPYPANSASSNAHNPYPTNGASSNAPLNNGSPPSKIPNTLNPLTHLLPQKNFTPLPYPRNTLSAFGQQPVDNLFIRQPPLPAFPFPCNKPTSDPQGQAGPHVLAIQPIHHASDHDAPSSFATKPTLQHSPQFHRKDWDVSSERHDKEREMQLRISMTSGLEKQEEKPAKNNGSVDDSLQEDRESSENARGHRQLVDLAHIVTAFG